MIGVKLGAKAKNYDFDVSDINLDALQGKTPDYSVSREGITISHNKSNYVVLDGDFRLWQLLGGNYEKGIKHLDSITVVENGRVSYVAKSLDMTGKDVATSKLFAQFLEAESYTITGNKFANDITGGMHRDVLRGMDGNDELRGMSGNDRLIGGTGRDRLIGGEGKDVLSGGKGADVFEFSSGDGHDVITDFQAHGRGRDLLDLRGHDGVSSFRDLDISSHGSTVTIGVGDDTITLRNVEIGRIDASDFLF